MSIVSIMLGLDKIAAEDAKRAQQVNQPAKNDKKRSFKHLAANNARRREAAVERYNKVLRDMVMSTSDIAKRLGIRRDSCMNTLSRFEKEGVVVRVGETIHAEDKVRVAVWKLSSQFLEDEK